jgi:predicted kinase
MSDHSEPESSLPPVKAPTAQTFGAEPELIIVCGYPGVGKSTVSEFLADELDGKRFRSDAIRKELFSNPTYTTEESETVYGTAFERARDRLTEGQTVVLDASFASKHHREQAQAIANDCSVPFRLVHVACNEKEVLARIKRRDGISDADIEVYYEVREGFDPLERDCLEIDNSDTWKSTEQFLETLLP